jgi:hypothetical protein
MKTRIYRLWLWRQNFDINISNPVPLPQDKWSMQSLKWKFEFTGPNHILEFIFIYIVVLNKNLLVPTKFTGLGPENMCSSWGLLMIVRLSTLNQDETIMSPSPFVSHLWLWGGQLWIKMKQLCLPLPSSVTYDCEEVNFESGWNNYASLSLRQSPMIVRRSTLNPKETVQQVQPPLIARGSILKPRVTFLPFFIAVSST